MKIKRHECKSIKEFNKIIRKYIKYFRNNYIYNTYWHTWIWVDVFDMNDPKLVHYAEALKKKAQPNLFYIIQDIKDNYGWKFKDLTYENPEFWLAGIEISNEDYYYIYINKDNVKLYTSCVGHFTDILYGKNRIKCT